MARTRRALAVAGLGIVALGVAVSMRPRNPLPPRPDPEEIRVVTYNIRAGLGGLDAIAEDLRRLSPDVVALQEVERGVERSRRVDQAALLGAALGMRFAYAGSFPSGGGEHGIAVLSRFPIQDSRALPLPQGSGRWPRVALSVRIEGPRGPFRFVCVHLARPWGWPLSNTRTRLLQLRALFRALAEEDLPLVLAGDFNSLSISPETFLISRHLVNAWHPWRDGWGASFPLRSIGWPVGSVRIDHIYHDAKWSSRGTWVAPQGASDHRAVVADLAADQT